MTPQYPCRRRRGLTLIELLIVVSMLIILVSVTTAMMQPVLADKEVREAARQLNAYVAGAIARAAELGRPSGIWIQRFAGASNAGFEVFYADEPAPYAGDTTASLAYCYATPPSSGPYLAPTQVTFSGNFNAALVKAGDQIQLNGAGPWYSITANPTASNATISVAGKAPPPYYYAPGVPYQIRRQPRKSSIKPLEMPNNTTIDLANSGVGVGGLATAFSVGTDPVVIMFNPNGSIDRVYYNGVSTPVTSSVYLLVGRMENIGAGNLGTAPNECRWVSVNHQTGTVLTSENMGVNVATARQFGRSGKGMGGT